MDKQPTELEQWVELFGILNKYEFSKFSVTAEHDQLWLHFPTHRLGVNDRKRIEELGWDGAFDGTAITKFV